MYDKTFLIKLTSILYTFLAGCGVAFEGPVLIQVRDANEANRLMHYLDVYGLPTIMSIGDIPKKFRSALAMPDYGVQVFTYARTRYTHENLLSLSAFYKNSVISTGLTPLMLVISAEFIPECYLDLFSGSLRISDVPGTGFLEDFGFEVRDFILLVLKYQKTIIKKMACVRQALDIPGMEVFEAAKICLVTVLECDGVDDGIVQEISAQIDKTIDDIREEWELGDDPEIYLVAFQNHLAEMVNKNFGEIIFIDRNKVQANEIDLVDEAVLFDEHAYYFPEDLFRVICEPFLNSVGISYVKDQLCRAGALEIEGHSRSYATKKVGTVNVFGATRRTRKVKMWREALDGTGQLSFMEMCQAKTKGGGGDE